MNALSAIVSIVALCASAASGVARAEREYEPYTPDSYYKLTEQDITRLESPGKAIAGLEKRQDKLPVNKEQFEAPVTEDLKGAEPRDDVLRDAILRNARVRTKITDYTIQILKANRAPEELIALAESIKDVPYLDEIDLMEALEEKQIEEEMAKGKKATADKAAADKVVAAKVAAANVALDMARMTNAAAQNAKEEKAAAERTVAEKTKAWHEAVRKADAAKAAHEDAKEATRKAQADLDKKWLFRDEKEKIVAKQTAVEKAKASEASDARKYADTALEAKEAAETALTEKIEAEKAATEKAAQKKYAAENAVAEKETAEEAARASAKAQMAAAERAVAEKTAVHERVADKRAAAKAALRRANAASAAVENAKKEKAAAAKTVEDKKKAWKDAVRNADAANSAAEDAKEAEGKAKEALEKKWVFKAGKKRALAQKEETAKAAAKAALEGKYAAEDALEVKVAAETALTEKIEAEKAAMLKAAVENDSAEKAAAERAAAEEAATESAKAQVAAVQKAERQDNGVLDIYEYEPLIREGLVQSAVYDWTVEATVGLEREPEFVVLPAFIVDALKKLKDKEYPTKELFEDAVRASVIDMFTSQGAADPGRDWQIVMMFPSGPQMKRISEEAHKPLDGNRTGWIEWTDACRGCVLAEKLPGALGAGSGMQKGTVYGLYPWRHAQVKPDKPSIDFSVLSRIAYFVVPITNEGKLDETAFGSGEPYASVETARRYGTRVDWVVHRDWGGDKNVKDSLEQLEKSIADWLLKPKRDDPLGRAQHLLSFGSVPKRTRGDGVTLYFERFPPKDYSQFEVFFENLNKKLKEEIGEDAYAVNLLFSRANLDTGLFTCERLSKLSHDKERRKINNVKFLVMIEEPTSEIKKELRKKLEECRHGAERTDLQQAVVPVPPVFQYDAKSKERFGQDFPYYDFNFGGVGLWLLPVGTEVIPDEGLRDILLAEPKIEQQNSNYEKASNFLQSKHEWICTFVCPNRWAFLGLFEAFAILLIASLIALWARCDLQSKVKTHKAYFYCYLGLGIATVALFSALLMCDPAWAEVREGDVPFYVVITVVIVAAVWFYWKARQEASRP